MIEFNIPRDLLLTSNQRQHRMQVARATKTLRALGKHIGRQSQLAGQLPVAQMDRARLVVWISYPNRIRRDLGNAAPTIKALVDGLVSDLGILPDDNHRHLVGPDLRFDEALCDKRFGAVMRFDFQPLADGERAA